MQAKTRKIAELKPAPYNPRTMPREEMEALKRSLQEFGWARPIIVNANPERRDVVVGGHQRLYAAQELGWDSCPTVEVDLDETREKLLNLALNRVGGEFDTAKLDAMLVGLEEEGADVTIAGFDGSAPAVEVEPGEAAPVEPGPSAEEETASADQCPRCGHANGQE